MFESSSNRKSNTTPSPGVSRNSIPLVFPAVTASVQLGGEFTRRLCNDIRAAVSDLPQDNFDQLYAPVLNAFSEYVQFLPHELAKRADASRLHQGLKRGLEMAKLAVEYNHPQPELFTYACFTAGLLMHLQQIARSMRVMITNKDGHYLYNWNPMCGSMLQQGAEFYRFRLVHGLYPAVGETLVVLIAQSLMPDLGYQWISGDDQLFADWLLLLQDPEHARGDVANIHAKFRHLFPNFDSLLDPTGQLTGPVEAPDLALGEDFLAWLQDKLRKGDISVNATDSPIHMISEGAFLNVAALAREYSELHGGQINVSDVTKQFRLMFGIFQDRRGPMGYMVDFLSMAPEQMQRRGAFAGSGFSSPHTKVIRGIVLRDAGVLYAGRTPPGASSTWGQRQPSGLNNQVPSAPKTDMNQASNKNK